MKNIYKLFYALFLLLAFSACKEDEEVYDYNKDWPRLTLVNVPASGMADSDITITGTDLLLAAKVTLGGKELEIKSATETELTVHLPRVFAAAPFIVTSKYNIPDTAQQNIVPEYPAGSVTAFPASLEDLTEFELMGENLHLVSSLEFKFNEEVKIVPVNNVNAESKTSYKANLPLLGFPNGSLITVEAISKYTTVTNAVSGPIPYTATVVIYEDTPGTLVLWNFENGDPFEEGDISPTHGINLEPSIDAPRGNSYLTVKEANVTDPWNVLIGTLTATDITLPEDFAMNDPHLSFLLNTNGKRGYFQLEMIQNGVKSGAHFKDNITGNSGDSYVFAARDNWEWVSVSLKDLGWEDWGSGVLSYDPSAPIESLQLQFKQGNGTNPYEIHLDQIMITDGPNRVKYTLFNFEDGVDGFIPNGGATATAEHGINLSGIDGIGNNYFTVTVQSEKNWDWTGEIINTTPFNLGTVADPYINFWINTNGKKAFFQMELFQNETKWGTGITSSSYQTNGWELKSVKLSSLGWGNWGGDATSLDLTGMIDYIKIGFTTGGDIGAGEEYEINLDEVVISNGPMLY